MDNRNRPMDNEQEQTSQNTSSQKVINPFENSQPVEKDIEQSQEELDKEQAYKEALTERD
ncbi:MAG TPA: hypothetical protein VGN63_08120 [Flavisolibacter sp.]|jgi:hypothetical protein|nr:hypothetical protein [Flavisolibacter sp.]